ncbi:uroporphyrinogen-III synthase [Christiangramia sp. SM2212]|uniref:Uroporphyrinogen-III synthase n=1 Tax=Christiangramia sediminicola TaxID=3073267 RepID=A0ABU1ESR1_9FLAO|nr:uroporphyrinogen-III synthase [Christiangramia sp. SM2212]MDR5591440.1 uroporphyrinogen-III synthase [Christiangramia sp. SM2212]
MATVLSTKKLAVNQKELILNSGIGLVEYNAISIEFSDFEIKNSVIANAIFTSKNALMAIQKKNLSIENSFCVGEKTAAFATESGFKVIEITDNAEELAKKIIENHHQKEFQFFSGNKRRDELPELLKNNDIKFTETQVYKTGLNYQKFNSEFDGILFFSPSGVKSFTENNKLNTTAFCIGNTTAEEAEKHTINIVTATRPGIENVIAKVVSNLKNK